MSYVKAQSITDY